MSVNRDFNFDVLDKVAMRQLESMFAVVKLIIFEPINIGKAFYVLFINILLYVQYNFVFLWRIFDATFRFTEEGFLYAFTVIFFYVEFFANDYEEFVALLQDNIWGIAGAVIFWPIYISWIIFRWLFGI